MTLSLHNRGLGTGKLTRLHRMLYQYGNRNGTLLLLPYDHGLEHGPRDFAANPESADPHYVLDLAIRARFNGVALQIGQARKCYASFAGRIPLVVKLNGKTEIPSDDAPLSPLNATVEEAVSLGADAVGYTLYVGSSRQADDFTAFRSVRQECERYGIPLIVWAYPRGADIARKGGRDSFYAVDYAARVAAELGADVVKVNWPSPVTSPQVPEEYRVHLSDADRISAIVRSAGSALVLLSGGDLADTAVLLERAGIALRAGAVGLIFGRNVLKRTSGEALEFAEQLRGVLRRSPEGQAGGGVDGQEWSVVGRPDASGVAGDR
ncbi:class I fructose-bisphosphate aldolase [Saccharothrix sp. NRRL B-16348]|uniref:class I fructose-bisphosphate aldolase n=1 Tax=Saccharothrix sp. NRRL B-16348 TaxID=1415542 RepID=UPI0007C67167|nr:fructose-bisphosphate aldolase [Saccharothrix sp. NRRL B-16348]